MHRGVPVFQTLEYRLGWVAISYLIEPYQIRDGWKGNRIIR